MDKPNKPGFYWVNNGGDISIVQVLEGEYSLEVLEFGGEISHPISYYDDTPKGFWISEIEPPKA